MKFIRKMLLYKKSLFCYALILVSIIFSITVAILTPLKIEKNYIYDSGIESEYIELKSPIVQHIKINSDNLAVMNIYLKDTNSNDVTNEKYNLQVELYDENQVYFNEKLTQYESEFIQINLGKISISPNNDFTLKITCKDCDDIKIPVGKSTSKNSQIEGLTNKTLKILYTSYVPNNSYHWYSILCIVIGLTLLPLARGEEHEK